MGFSKVFDYMLGKADWSAYGLPLEREEAEPPMVIERMERQTPTCRLNEPIGAIKRRAQKEGFALCPVVNELGIVLGAVSEDEWGADPATPAERVMEPGPVTLRPNVSVQNAAEYLGRIERNTILVTSSDGKLMGVFETQRPDREKPPPQSEIRS
jgi:predicted transcriptional regulator